MAMEIGRAFSSTAKGFFSQPGTPPYLQTRKDTSAAIGDDERGPSSLCMPNRAIVSIAAWTTQRAAKAAASSSIEYRDAPNLLDAVDAMRT